MASEAIFASWQLGAFGVVDHFSGFLVSNGHARHASLDVRMTFRPECDVFDIQRSPDILFHVLLQRLASDPFDQLTGPVEASAIKPASAGLIDQRLNPGFFYCCTGSYLEHLRMLAIALDALTHR